MLKVVSSRPQDIFNESDIALIRYLKELNGDSQQEKAELSRIVNDPRFELVRVRVLEDFQIIKSEHDLWKSRSYWGSCMFYLSPAISVLIVGVNTLFQRINKLFDFEAKERFALELLSNDGLLGYLSEKEQLDIISDKYSKYVDELIPDPYEEFSKKDYALFEQKAFTDAWQIMIKNDPKTAISLCMMTMIFVSLKFYYNQKKKELQSHQDFLDKLATDFSGVKVEYFKSYLNSDPVNDTHKVEKRPEESKKSSKSGIDPSNITNAYNDEYYFSPRTDRPIKSRGKRSEVRSKKTKNNTTKPKTNEFLENEKKNFREHNSNNEIRVVVGGEQNSYIFVSVTKDDWNQEYPETQMQTQALRNLESGISSSHKGTGLVKCGPNQFKLKGIGKLVGSQRGLLGTLSPFVKVLKDGTKVRFLTLNYSKQNQKLWH